MSRTKLRPRRRSAGHARRPSRPLRRRLGARLPSRARLLALLVFVVALSGLVMLVYGPWLRITSVAHAGQRYTSAAELDAMVEAYRGTSLLTVDSEALRARLTALPTVADATVRTMVPGELRVAITEKSPAFVWRTSAVQLISARGRDGPGRARAEQRAGRRAGRAAAGQRPATGQPRPDDGRRAAGRRAARCPAAGDP